jgi:hypothetical protein
LFIAHTVIASMHQAGTVFDVSVFEFQAETTVTIQLFLASVMASHIGLSTGLQAPQKLMLMTFMPFALA